MSAQGATLRRGTAHLPMWPLAVLAAGAAAIVLAISLFNVRPEAPVRTVTDTERFENSSATVREQGAAFPEISPIPVTSNPGQWTYSNAKAYVDDLAQVPGMARYAAYEESILTHPVGLENPSVGVSQITEMTDAVGLENPSVGISQVTETPGTVVRPGFITADTVCGQCR